MTRLRVDGVVARHHNDGEASIQRVVGATAKDGATCDLDASSVQRCERTRVAVVAEVVGGFWALAVDKDGKLWCSTRRACDHPALLILVPQLGDGIALVVPHLATAITHFGAWSVEADGCGSSLDDRAVVGFEEEAGIDRVCVQRDLTGFQVGTIRALALEG